MDGRIACDCCDHSYFPTTFATHHAGNKAEKPLDALKVVFSPSSSMDLDYFDQPSPCSKSLREVLQQTPSWTSLRMFQHIGMDGNDFANKRLFDEDFDGEQDYLPESLLGDDQPVIAIREETGDTLYQRLSDFLNHDEIQSHFSDVETDICDYLAPFDPTTDFGSSASSSSSSSSSASSAAFLYTPPPSSSPSSSPLHSDTTPSDRCPSPTRPAPTPAATASRTAPAAPYPPSSTFASLPPTFFGGSKRPTTTTALPSPFVQTPTAGASTRRSTKRSHFSPAPSDSEDSETESEPNDPEFKPTKAKALKPKPSKVTKAKSPKPKKQQLQQPPKEASSSSSSSSESEEESASGNGEKKPKGRRSPKIGRTGGSKGDRSSPAGTNFRLEIGANQVSVLVLRHQGNNGAHPKIKGQFYFQARIRNVYPQRHVWAGWETPEGMEPRIRGILEKS